MTVYNIENFVVNQMFRPYKNMIVAEKFQTEAEYKKIESSLRKEPLMIMWLLRNNKKAYPDCEVSRDYDNTGNIVVGGHFETRYGRRYRQYVYKLIRQ